MVNANEYLDLFIELIRELEVVPRDRFYKFRIKRLIKRLRRQYINEIKRKTNFDVKHMLNFTVLLNTVKNMKIIDNFDIEEKGINLYTKINQIDILFTGIWMSLVVSNNGEEPITIFNLRTKQLQDNKIYMDLKLEFHTKSIADYGTACDKNTVYNFNDIKEILEDNHNNSSMSENNINMMNTSFKFLKNIFIMHYNHLFNELERKYLK